MQKKRTETEYCDFVRVFFKCYVFPKLSPHFCEDRLFFGARWGGPVGRTTHPIPRTAMEAMRDRPDRAHNYLIVYTHTPGEIGFHW